MQKDLLDYQEYLEAARIPLRISCATESGWPVVLSLWFYHRDNRLYCATQESARLVRYLRNDQRCAFEIAADQPPYCGIRGQALAKIDSTNGVEVLKELLVRYTGNTENRLARTLLANSRSEVAIVLEPLRVFSWNYTRRMPGSQEKGKEKICP